MTDDAGRIAMRVRIYGRVQGVWYRAWTTRTAGELGLSGWVRNRADGTVEAVFVGEPAAVETMIAQCEAGPPDAEVERVERDSEDPADHPEPGFRQLPTA